MHRGVKDGDFSPKLSAATDPAPRLDRLGDWPGPAHHQFTDRLVAALDPDRVRRPAVILGRSRLATQSGNAGQRTGLAQ
ncbi:hypothetical protein D3C81_2247650 [compost metagenome]